MSNRKKSSQNYAPKAWSVSSDFTAMRLRILWGVAIIIVAALLVYLPSLSGGFVLDDNYLLTENKLIKAVDGLYRFWFTAESPDYWPVTYSTLWFEWRLWGMNPTGYHVTNLILHIVESSLIWFILRKLSIPGAFLAALIFAVHPVNVESVAWISQRKNMTAMLFFLSSILCYLKSEEKTPGTSAGAKHENLILQSINVWYWLSLAAFILAMLSKGSAAVLPALLLGIIWWLRTGDCPNFPGTMRIAWSAKMGLSLYISRRDLVRTAPFFLVSVVLTAVNLWFQTHGAELVIRKVTFTERLLGAGGVVWFYLYKALLPFNLAFIYPQWQIKAGNLLWWMPILSALAVTVVLWLYRKNWSRPFLFAWGFFCVALLPVLGFTDVGFMKYSLVADHYQHIAIIGVVALAAAGWSAWHRRTRGNEHWIASASAVAAVVGLAVLTWWQSGLYHDAVTLYKDTLEKNPGCWIAHNNLGGVLVQTGQARQAVEHYRQALGMKPDSVDAYSNLGGALVKTGRTQEAIEHLQQALRLNPDYPEALYNMGVALVQAGRTAEGIDYYKQALKLKPDYIEAHINFGNALKAMGQYQQAIEQFEIALRINPDSFETHNNLGNTLKSISQYQQALGHFETALRLNPDYPETHNNLGATLAQTGRVQEAIEHFEQAVRLKPAYPEAHYNLGLALLETGRVQEAIEHFHEAVRLKPDYIEARNYLGSLLVKTSRHQEAIEHFKQVLQLKPDDIFACYNLALAYAGTHQSREAIAAAQRALELARSKNQPAEARQIEEWLNSYQGRKE